MGGKTLVRPFPLRGRVLVRVFLPKGTQQKFGEQLRKLEVREDECYEEFIYTSTKTIIVCLRPVGVHQ